MFERLPPAIRIPASGAILLATIGCNILFPGDDDEPMIPDSGSVRDAGRPDAFVPPDVGPDAGPDASSPPRADAGPLLPPPEEEGDAFCLEQLDVELGFGAELDADGSVSEAREDGLVILVGELGDLELRWVGADLSDAFGEDEPVTVETVREGGATVTRVTGERFEASVVAIATEDLDAADVTWEDVTIAFGDVLCQRTRYVACGAEIMRDGIASLATLVDGRRVDSRAPFTVGTSSYTVVGARETFAPDDRDCSRERIERVVHLTRLRYIEE